MMPGPATAGLFFVGCGVLLASGWAWLIAAMKAALSWQWVCEPLAGQIDQWLRSLGYRAQLPLVAWNPRRPVPWALVDLLVVIGTYVVAGVVVALAAREIGTTVFTAGDAVVKLDEHGA